MYRPAVVGGPRSLRRRVVAGGRLAAVVAVVRHRELRRLQVAWGAWFLVDAMVTVALAVWAFRDGGTARVGVVGVARLLPGAVALPFGAWAADRFPRRRVVAGVFAATGATLAALAAVVAVDAPAGVVVGLAAMASISMTPYRPAHLALVPVLARTPDELVASNVASSSVEGVTTLAGPVVAAVLLAVTEPWVVVAASAAAALAGLVAVARLDIAERTATLQGVVADGPVRALAGGLADLRDDRELAAIVGAFVAQLAVRGVLGVLAVTVAYELLGWGDSGVGWLAAATGIGGLLGSAAAVALTGRRRLGFPMALALAAWSAPIAVIGLVPRPAVALAAMAVVGVANGCLDVAGFTLIQRLGPDRTMGRVFGVLYTSGIAAGSLGALVAPALVDAAGLRTVLVATGAVLPVLALALAPVLRRIDARAEPVPALVRLFGRVRLLSALPPPVLERLASRAVERDVAPGEPLVVEGRHGDRFFVVVDGELDVTQSGRHRRTLHAGDHFGEIALVQGSRRTATVTARGPARVASVPGPSFLDALSVSEPAFGAAQRHTAALADDDARPSGS